MASHNVHLIYTDASSSELFLEQMSERDESIPSSQTRKKRRGLGFRYSSKKDLQRSKMKRRTAKAGGSELASVTKALSYPRALPSGGGAGAGGPHGFDILEEDDGKRLELSHDNVLLHRDCLLKVRIF
jgi:hypothetical protein